MNRFPVTKVLISRKPLPRHQPKDTIRLRPLEPFMHLYMRLPFYLKYFVKTAFLSFGILGSMYAAMWFYSGNFTRADKQASVEAVGMSRDQYKQIKVEEDRLRGSSQEWRESSKVKQIYNKY